MFLLPYPILQGIGFQQLGREAASYGWSIHTFSLGAIALISQLSGFPYILYILNSAQFCTRDDALWHSMFW